MMCPPSKLGRFCENFISSAWLATAILSPLFFNIYSARIFEPDKAMMVCGMAVFMATASIILFLEKRQKISVSLSAFLQAPLSRAYLLVIASLLISTVSSLNPHDSIWGGYVRMQGLYTTFSCMLVFFLLAYVLKGRIAPNRAIQIIIFTSLPVCTYAVLQHCGLDPFPWKGQVGDRIASTMGNPIFLGAYLNTVFFLTMARAIQHGHSSSSRHRQERMVPLALLFLYTLICIVQITALSFTASRGPMIAWSMGVFFFVLVLLIRLRLHTLPWQTRAKTSVNQLKNKTLKWLWLIWIICIVLTVAFFVELNRPSSPMKGLYSIPGIERMEVIYQQAITEKGSSSVRLFIWQGVSKLIVPHKALVLSDNKTDSYNTIRPLIGYGPESMISLFSRHAPPGLATLQSYGKTGDRSHNDTFDILFNRGLLGLLAQQFFLLSLFSLAFKKLGLIESRKEHALFVLLWIGSASATTAICLKLFGIQALGIAIPAGVVSALFFYLIRITLTKTDWKSTLPLPQWIALLGLLSAILANYIEKQTGIPTVTDMFIFWSLAALIVAIPRQLPHSVTSGNSNYKIAPLFIFLSVVTITILFSFFHNRSGETTFSAIFISIFTGGLQQSTLKDSITPLLLLPVWLFVPLIWSLESRLARNPDIGQKFTKHLLSAMLATGVVSLFFGLAMAFLFKTVNQLQLKNGSDLLALTEQLATLPLFYFTAIFLIVLVAALWESFGSVSRKLNTGYGIGAFFLLPLLALAGFSTYQINLKELQANTIHNQASVLLAQQLFDDTLIHNLRAAQLAPGNDIYLMFLGKNLLRKAQGSTVPGSGIFDNSSTLESVLRLDNRSLIRLGVHDLMLAAQIVLKEARKRHPLKSDNSANLAQLYQTWATMLAIPKEKNKKTVKTFQLYKEAINFSPSNCQLINQEAMAHILLQQDTEAAMTQLNRSLRINPKYCRTYGLIGDIYKMEHNMAAAYKSYEQALAHCPEWKEIKQKLAEIDPP